MVHRLAAESLLQVIPRKGVMVAPLSIDDAQELIEVRLVNEGLCARLAAQHITEAALTTLRDLNRQIAAACDKRDHA